MIGVNPFLGARPYGAADDLMFFGRSAATAGLVERLSLRPLTILTSPSGIGKTSLLRAAVLPELERSGLCTVYMRPDPGVEGDAAATLLEGGLANAMAASLLPDPTLEAKRLGTLRAAAPIAATLAEARTWFAALTARDPVRLQLLATPEGSVDCLPMLARFLRGSLAPEAMAAQTVRLGGEGVPPLTSETMLDALDECFSAPAFAGGVAGALAALRAVSSSREGGRDNVRGAVGLLTRGQEDKTSALLVRPDGDPELSVRIVLVLDQFEQIFTLAASDTRARALRVLGDLLDADLPVHLVLALRKEWYADLIQLLPQFYRSTEPADRSTFHLQPMTRAEALEVMVEAPQQTGADVIAPDQRETLWNGLQQDDSVDAVALSIACHELFAVGEAAESLLTEAGVEGLLEAYLRRALDAITDPADHDEALDMLGEIAGSDSTRSFVTHTRLLKAPLRDPARRVRVLSALQRAFLVKGDSPRRFFDKVYDIMHERLLCSLRALIAKHARIAAFREAAERMSQVDGRGWLDWHHCCALLAGSRRAKWDSRSAGILLRSFVQEVTRERLDDVRRGLDAFADVTPPDTKQLDWLRAILVQLAEAAATPPVRASFPDRRRLSWWMTPEEIGRRATEPADADADALAIASALRGRGGLMRREVFRLALRLPPAPSAAPISGAT